MRNIQYALGTLALVVILSMSSAPPAPIFNLYYSPDTDADTITGVDVITLTPGLNLDGKFTYNYTISIAAGDSTTADSSYYAGKIYLFENAKDPEDDGDYANGWYPLDTLTISAATLYRTYGELVYGRRHKLEIHTTDSNEVITYDVDAVFKRD